MCMRKSIILTKEEYYVDYTYFTFVVIRKVRKLRDTYKIRVYIDDICSYRQRIIKRKYNGAINHSSIRKPSTWVEIVGKNNSCSVKETPAEIKTLIEKSK